MVVGGLQSQAVRAAISLRGSAEIVSEFFDYAVNSILFQRGIYPPETFTRVSKYGLTMLVSTDEKLKEYLKAVLEQLSQWLMGGEVERVIVVVKSLDSGKVLERWAFDIETDKAGLDEASGEKMTTKSTKEIITEIQAIIRQITASVTFLPLLDEPCKFDMLIYTRQDATTPDEWEESDPHYICNQQVVQLRSFSTSIHQVDAIVAYANEDDDLI